jgi:hypothetical protein
MENPMIFMGKSMENPVKIVPNKPIHSPVNHPTGPSCGLSNHPTLVARLDPRCGSLA